MSSDHSHCCADVTAVLLISYSWYKIYDYAEQQDIQDEAAPCCSCEHLWNLKSFGIVVIGNVLPLQPVFSTLYLVYISPQTFLISFVWLPTNAYNSLCK